MIGIGLNVDTADGRAGAGVARDRHLAADRDRRAAGRDTALDALFDRLAAWTDALGQPEVVTNAFRKRDALFGREIAWTQNSQRMSGAARGIDDAGRLVVFTGGSEPVRLDAGEVHLKPRRPGR